ncbi:MAG: hypothetical protein U5R06_23915 [candidate division KSB1 bacterium]|nr:hypothetical protein [candidate division KSB1 bacterium]
MAKKKTQQNKALGTRNYVIFGIAVLLLVAGYVIMAQGSTNSAAALTVAPILLVIAYCVLVPIAILLKPKKSLGD